VGLDFQGISQKTDMLFFVSLNFWGRIYKAFLEANFFAIFISFLFLFFISPFNFWSSPKPLAQSPVDN